MQSDAVQAPLQHHAGAGESSRALKSQDSFEMKHQSWRLILGSVGMIIILSLLI